MAALAIGGLVSWAYVWYRKDGALSLEQVSAEMSRLIVQMVKAETPPAASRGTRYTRAPGKARSVR